MKKIIFLFILFSFRAQAECISESHVQEMAAVYTQFDQKGKICDSSDPEQFTILKTLLTLQAMKLAPGVTDSDGGVTSVIQGSWAKYLSSHVGKIVVGDPTRCESGDLAYTRVGDSTGTIYVCKRFVENRGSGIYENISTLLHEARHLETQVGHVVCTHGEFKGVKNACDRSIADKGSYAVSIQSLAKMSREGSNIHPVAHQMNRSKTIATALQNLNVAPLLKRERTPLLLSANGQLQVLGDRNLKTVAKDLPAGFLATWDSSYILFPQVDGHPIQLSPSLLVRRDNYTADAYARGVDSWSAADRSSIVGIHYGSHISVWLEKSRLVATCGGQSTTLNPGQGSFQALIYPDGYSSSQTSVHVLDSQGQWGVVRCDERHQAVLEWQTPQFTGLSKLMKIGGETYGLSRGGHLVRLAVRNGRRAWTIVPQTKALRYRDIQAFERIRYIDHN